MKKEQLHTNKKSTLSLPALSLLSLRNSKGLKGPALCLSKGFSLIEILVAFSIFLILVITFSDLIISSNRQIKNTGNKERALVLAEEALEATRNIRDIDFTNLIDGTYGLSTTGNQWAFSGSSDTVDIFDRTLTISPINANQKKVEATVSWVDRISENNSVTLKTYLTNWLAPLDIGLTIDKVVINHGGTKTIADFLPNFLSTTSWDNSVEPPVSQNIDIPIIFAPSTMNLIPNTYTFLTTNDPDYDLTLSTDCGAGSIILNNGDAKICTITYEEKNTSGITFIGSSVSSGSTATIPAHQPGDLLIAFSYRDGNASSPALASGWTNISNTSGSNANGSRLAYRIATGSDTAVGWTNATLTIISVYRGQSTNPIGANFYQSGSGTTVTYPTLALQQTDGTSWVIGFAGHRSTNTNLQNSPTGMINRSTFVNAVSEVASHDTNSGTSLWTANNVSVGGTSSGWMTRVLEIKSQ